jgi:hypothetical protein
MAHTTFDIPFVYQMVDIEDATTPSPSWHRSVPGRNIGGVLIANDYFNFFFRATGIRYEIAAQFYPNVIRFFSPEDLAAFSHHFNLALHAPRNYGIERGKPYFALPFKIHNTPTTGGRGRNFNNSIVTNAEFMEFFEDTQFRYEVSGQRIEGITTVQYQPEVRFQDEMELKLFCMKFGISRPNVQN